MGDISWGLHALFWVRWITESNGEPIFYKSFFYPDWTDVQYWSICQVQMLLSEALASTGMQPGSVVVVPLFMSEKICVCIQLLQRLSVSLMRSLMRLSLWTGAKASDGLWNLLFPLAAWGVFHYCTVRLRNPLLSRVPQLGQRAETAQTGAKKRHNRLMTVTIDPCHLLQLWSRLLLSGFFFLNFLNFFLKFYKDICMYNTFTGHLTDSVNIKSKCGIFLSRIILKKMQTVTCILSRQTARLMKALAQSARSIRAYSHIEFVWWAGEQQVLWNKIAFC